MITYEDWLKQVTKWLMQQWQLSELMAQKTAYLLLYLSYYRIPFTITSGYRSLEKQKELIRLWNSGVRKGFKGKPATNSPHVRHDWLGRPASDAIDIHINSGYDVADYFARQLGLRVGSDFRDPGHYDLGQKKV